MDAQAAQEAVAARRATGPKVDAALSLKGAAASPPAAVVSQAVAPVRLQGEADGRASVAASRADARVARALQPAASGTQLPSASAGRPSNGIVPLP